MNKKNIIAIIGSASDDSANQKLVDNLVSFASNVFNITIFNELKLLPHFNPELSVDNTPPQVVNLRNAIAAADGIIICTPEYVFSIPSGLKNAIEWCVSTTIFSEKPTGLITASAQGKKAHEELLLIMQTLMARVNPKTTLLIQGVKGKINEKGEITDSQTKADLLQFIKSFELLFD